MADRRQQIQAFLASHGWHSAARSHLAGDASFRRYERLALADDRRVLMDAPPEQEDVRPFLQVTEHLLTLGFSAPRVYARDEALGLLLLEDFGDRTFTHALAAGVAETDLYSSAVDVLIDLHSRPFEEAVPAGIPAYDEERLMAEAMLLIEWFLRDQISEVAAGRYEQIWRRLLAVQPDIPATLVLRDFHADNLFWLPDRPGVRRCGLIDYQDAVAGSPAYDLMSLLQDARRDLAPGLEDRLIDRYLRAVPGADADGFNIAYRLLAAQRHCKVIGIFSRLAVRDGKEDYLLHIGRVIGRLKRACAAPELAALRNWLAENMPTPEEFDSNGAASSA